MKWGCFGNESMRQHITQSEEKLPVHKSGVNLDPDVRSSGKVQNSTLYHSAISDPWVKICHCHKCIW